MAWAVHRVCCCTPGGCDTACTGCRAWVPGTALAATLERPAMGLDTEFGLPPAPAPAPVISASTVGRCPWDGCTSRVGWAKRGSWRKEPMLANAERTVSCVSCLSCWDEHCCQQQPRQMTTSTMPATNSVALPAGVVVAHLNSCASKRGRW